MKRILAVILSIIGITLFPNNVQAQSIKPIIDFCLPDPDFDFELGETIDIYVHVKAKSCLTDADTSVYGNLYYWFQTDTMASISASLFDNIDDQPWMEYIPIGGKMDTIPFYCDSSQLRAAVGGPTNVIIIWPAFISPTAPVCDSGQYVLSAPIFPSIGIDNLPAETFGSKAYPNPANGLELVYIDSKYGLPVNQVIIYNAMGQVSFQTKFPEGYQSNGYVIPTQELIHGVYFIHLIYQDRKSEVVKFIKN